jgi:hypothetical protein
MGTFKNSGEKGEGLSTPARKGPSFSRAKNQEEESGTYDQNSVFSSRTCLSGKPETTGAALEIMDPRFHGNESGDQRSSCIQTFK